MGDGVVEIGTDRAEGYRGRLGVRRSRSGRRIWSAAEKGRIVRESFGRGAAVNEVARRHGVSPQQLTRWRREARSGQLALVEDAASAFVPLAVDDAAPADSTPMVIEIVVGRVVVRAGCATSAERLPVLPKIECAICHTVRLPAGGGIRQVFEHCYQCDRTRLLGAS